MRLSPVDPPGVLGFFADEPPKLELATWRAETVQVRSTLPSLQASWENPQAQAMEYVIVAEYGSGMVGTCSLTRSKFRRDDSHSLCHMTMMIWNVAASFDYARLGRMAVLGHKRSLAHQTDRNTP